MKQYYVAIAVVGALAALAASCTRNVSGGNPNLTLSNTNGVAAAFDLSESSVKAAITNAFSGHRYRGMLLENSQDYPGWHLKDGYVLSPFLGPNWEKNAFPSVGGAITNVSLTSGKSVPYSPFFCITVTPTASNRITVTVRTFLAQVDDGQETGIHGGWANHSREVLPVRQEEQNVVDTIAHQLNANQSKARP